MNRMLHSFLRDESGATAIEYCMIASCISIVIVVSMNSIGGQVVTMFEAAAAGFGL